MRDTIDRFSVLKTPREDGFIITRKKFYQKKKEDVKCLFADGICHPQSLRSSPLFKQFDESVIPEILAARKVRESSSYVLLAKEEKGLVFMEKAEDSRQKLSGMTLY